MPTRLLREGILKSERVDALDFASEVFYRRLMSKVDDHGLYDARPSVLRADLYPLRLDRVREADITRWIAICEKAGLIALYQSGGKPYLQMLDTRWQTRAEPRFPLPPENSCKQLQTPVHLVECGDVVVYEEEQDASPKARPARSGLATRLAEDWALPAPWREWAVKNRPDINPDQEAEKFADYWRAAPGKDGRKANWLATWRNWIRNAWVSGGNQAKTTQARPVAGNSPEVIETPDVKIAEAKKFYEREVGEGRMTSEKARAEFAKVKAKYSS